MSDHINCFTSIIKMLDFFENLVFENVSRIYRPALFKPYRPRTTILTACIAWVDSEVVLIPLGKRRAKPLTVNRFILLNRHEFSDSIASTYRGSAVMF